MLSNIGKVNNFTIILRPSVYLSISLADNLGLKNRIIIIPYIPIPKDNHNTYPKHPINHPQTTNLITWPSANEEEDPPPP